MQKQAIRLDEKTPSSCKLVYDAAESNTDLPKLASYSFSFRRTDGRQTRVYRLDFI